MWVLIDIGCLECGGESRVIGVYKTAEEGMAKAEEYGLDVAVDDWWHGMAQIRLLPVEGPWPT